MTTKTNELRLAKVKLVEGGLKGVILTYEQTEIRNNREFYTEFPGVKKKFPIHRELEDCFKWLRKYLLEICDYPQDESYIQSVEMTSISYTDKGFVLSGKLSVLQHNKCIALNTPLVTGEEDYANYTAVTKILDAIYAETKEYVGGKKMMSDTEIVIRYNKGNSEFDIEAFNNLPNEEQMRISTEVMQKNKCMVFLADEIEEGEEIVVEEAVAPEPIVAETVVIEPVIAEVIQEEPVTIPSTTEEPLLVEDGDDFSFNFIKEPILQSTAKRK